MRLTLAQLQSLKAHIVANLGGVYGQVETDALNALVVPDYFIFKGKIDLAAVMANGYDWTMVDNETPGRARIWDRMLYVNDKQDGVEPWKITVLRGVGECYKGNTPAGMAAHRQNILRNHFCRPCRVWEKLFVIASADWNVGTNNDMTGARGVNTNPDIMPLDADGAYLYGVLHIDTVITAASVPSA